jgi:hypothetical protein
VLRLDDQARSNPADVPAVLEPFFRSALCHWVEGSERLDNRNLAPSPIG